jgi:hypothetical protein
MSVLPPGAGGRAVVSAATGDVFVLPPADPQALVTDSLARVSACIMDHSFAQRAASPMPRGVAEVVDFPDVAPQGATNGALAPRAHTTTPPATLMYDTQVVPRSATMSVHPLATGTVRSSSALDMSSATRMRGPHGLRKAVYSHANTALRPHTDGTAVAASTLSDVPPLARTSAPLATVATAAAGTGGGGWAHPTELHPGSPTLSRNMSRASSSSPRHRQFGTGAGALGEGVEDEDREGGHSVIDVQQSPPQPPQQQRTQGAGEAVDDGAPTAPITQQVPPHVVPPPLLPPIQESLSLAGVISACNSPTATAGAATVGGSAAVAGRGGGDAAVAAGAHAAAPATAATTTTAANGGVIQEHNSARPGATSRFRFMRHRK